MNDIGFQPGPVTRPVGLETEFGVLRPGCLLYTSDAADE